MTTSLYYPSINPIINPPIPHDMEVSVSARFTTDLHALGQYIQEGLRNFFESVLYIKESPKTIVIKGDEKDLEGLNFLSEKTLDYVNMRAMEGTMIALLGKRGFERRGRLHLN